MHRAESPETSDAVTIPTPLLLPPGTDREHDSASYVQSTSGAIYAETSSGSHYTDTTH